MSAFGPPLFDYLCPFLGVVTSFFCQQAAKTQSLATVQSDWAQRGPMITEERLGCVVSPLLRIAPGGTHTSCIPIVMLLLVNLSLVTGQWETAATIGHPTTSAIYKCCCRGSPLTPNAMTSPSHCNL